MISEENLIQKSIDAALECNWKEAIKYNLQVIKSDPSDLDALNRLAKAYFENNELSKAIKTTKKVLKLSPKNNIAINSIIKYSQNKSPKNSKTKLNNLSFIEEPGKTKLTTLINLGSEKTCSSLSIGNEVKLVPHSHKVSVVSMDGAYIGKLTDDLSARLRILIKNGCKYKVIIKSVSINCVKVFIKGDKASFPRGSSESLSEFGS